MMVEGLIFSGLPLQSVCIGTAFHTREVIALCPQITSICKVEINEE